MFLLRFLGKLLKAIWYGLNTVRRILHLILLLGIFLTLVAVLVKEPVPLPSSAALLVDPVGPLVEQLQGGPLDRALAELNGNPAPEVLLKDVVDSLDMAAGDERIKAVVLQLDEMEGGGLPKLQAIAASLDKVRAAGKKVIAVGSFYERDQYYLAAHADEIIMDDLGIVYVEGYEYFRTYFRDAIEKLAIDLNVFRVGEYKSFVEPFIRDDMSAEDKEASSRWLGALWTSWRRDVLAARKLEPAVLDAYVNEMAEKVEKAGGNGGQAALESGLVDRLMGRPAVNDYLVELVGESEAEDGFYSSVSFLDYIRTMRLEKGLGRGKEHHVGIIVASGTIVDGEAPMGTVGGDTLASVLQDARLDDSIDAVVLRIDSPGGSMFASEVVFDEVAALKAAGKPVVASMSTVAASGGYYIAMLADEIWASESTITGSIGVGALVPTVQRSLDKLGVHVDGIGTTRLAGQGRLDRELGEDARRVITASVEDAYEIFVNKVADSRELTAERADSVARGRVWIGSDALDLGLVDHLGSIDDAVAAAASRAGLDEGSYDVRTLEPELTLGQRMALGFVGTALAVGRHLGPLAIDPRPDGLIATAGRALEREWRTLSMLNDPRGLYLHCLCMID